MPQKRKELNIQGSNLWYLAGLIASDGCLSRGGRHIDITSANREFLEDLKAGSGLVNKIGVKNKRLKNQGYRFQIANKNFYGFLLSIGLMPDKSLKLEQIQTPKNYFLGFLRGDSDGGTQRRVHPANGREQWSLRITSGSIKFLAWLKEEIEKIVKAQGKIYSESETQNKLKYGKMAAKEIIKQRYYKGCLGLSRKIKLAKTCLESDTGWSISKTGFH
jgi:hypothetical protein